VTDIEGLRQFSAKLGSDQTLVQGAGGNTSLKSNGEMIVKASGKRLADALTEDVFARVALDATDWLTGSPESVGSLRPSIETSLHAILPYRVVAHVHSVDVIAIAVREDAQSQLAVALQGLSWQFVPYVRPGLPLANAVQAAGPSGHNIFVLGNHGLLVGADDFDSCEALIHEVRHRVEVAPRAQTTKPEQLDTIAHATGLAPAEHSEAHWCALSEASLAAAIAGTLYPDHVVFLGRGATEITGASPPPSTAGKSELFLVPGVGAFLPHSASSVAHEMAGCLGMVTARIPEGARLRPLSPAQEDELLGWDAEKHRQRLASGKA
jgi:rhamnose utilization protein RhaD (predicted bifunctional aldolase and dehydrogenase)